MSSDDKYGVCCIVLLLVLLIALCVSVIQYKNNMEEAVEEFFKTCYKVDDKTIQCPIPKQE